MKPIPYIDRKTGQIGEEKVYGGKALLFLYGHSAFARWVGRPFRELISKFPFASSLMGWWQNLPFTRRKIEPFLQTYGVDAAEFLEPVGSFRSFNDFFIRRLKPDARPIDPDPQMAVIPADGRYWFYPKIENSIPTAIKGSSFSLENLLRDHQLAQRFRGGSLAIARLCPSDYHRFHFPCDCIPSKPRLINGPLYSVNPIALREGFRILAENKRIITTLSTPSFGVIGYIDVGATTVGTIHETFTPDVEALKGSEKGYFSFGGSCLVLLFEPGKIIFCHDLVEATLRGYETRCLLGEPMGRAVCNVKS